jgi:predicted PhzF superfamily epimerase YddE/YHI9
MPRYHLLRVFCGEGGGGGNPLAVFVAGGEIPPQERQRVAARLGLSETVFVDDAARGRMEINTPMVELGFAGHPVVGTAWLLHHEGVPVEALRPPAGEVAVRADGRGTFASGRPDWSPGFSWHRLGGPGAVEALDGPPEGDQMGAAWAWLDERAGIVRARVFPRAVGVAEDEATGSAAMRLCAELGRPIDIRQGRGSRILAAPVADGYVEIGGRVELDSVHSL